MNAYRNPGNVAEPSVCCAATTQELRNIKSAIDALAAADPDAIANARVLAVEVKRAVEAGEIERTFIRPAFASLFAAYITAYKSARAQAFKAIS